MVVVNVYTQGDSIRDRAGTGAPDFPNGATVTGVVTATSFSGNVTGNVTGTSAGLTGTPNITVGTVTGTDATFSGNLTVQGTTTTIDTAVTSVDSLAVDGSVGIGTTNPDRLLHLSSNTNTKAKIATTNETSFGLLYLGDEEKFIVGYRGSHPNEPHGIAIKATNAAGYISLFTGGDNERLGITSTGTAIFKAGLAEKFNNTGTTMSSGTHAIQSGNIIRFTGNESGANALNITGIHSTLANGEALSFTVICTPNGSGYISGFNIDGVAPATAIKWSGGSAPSASASGQDVYTFTVLKIGTATNAYEVYGAMTNYA